MKKVVNLAQASERELEIRKYFPIHGYHETIEKYQTSEEEIQKILVQYGSPAVLYRKRLESWTTEVLRYFEKHSLPQTASHFFISTDTLKRLLQDNSIPLRCRAEELELTRIEKYGSHQAYVAHVAERVRDTSIFRYGVDNPAKAQASKQKAVMTSRKRYGVDNPMQSNAVKETLKKTNQERYGVDWVQQNSDINHKSQRTLIEKYGGVGWESPLIRDKFNTQMENKYGATHWAQSDTLRQKVITSCREHWGVDWPCQSAQCRLSNDSKVNQRFEEKLIQHNISFTREFTIGRRSYDFQVGKTLIELDPTPTHNSTFAVYKGSTPLASDYHAMKSKLAEDNGYRCIHVWDWDNEDAILRLLQERVTVGARSCEVKEISSKDATNFLNTYHIQRNARATLFLGLYYKQELISVMSFGKPRYNKNYQWELVRYASSHNVHGGAEKLFSYFVSKYNPTDVVSYCDRSKFRGDTYYKLGFQLESESISKHWVSMRTGKHITDNLLRQRGFDQLLGKEYGYYGKGTSNDALMLQHDFVEIYDAGQATFSWKNNSIII